MMKNATLPLPPHFGAITYLKRQNISDFKRKLSASFAGIGPKCCRQAARGSISGGIGTMDNPVVMHGAPIRHTICLNYSEEFANSNRAGPGLSASQTRHCYRIRVKLSCHCLKAISDYFGKHMLNLLWKYPRGAVASATYEK